MKKSKFSESQIVNILKEAEDPAMFIPRFYLGCIASSMLFGDIRNSTATFWPAVIMHAVMNLFGHPLFHDLL